MNKVLIALAAASAAISAAPAFADHHAAAPAAPAAAAALSVESSTIGDLLDNPAAKAVLVKHMAGMAENPQIEMARGMTLKQIQGFAPDQITDEALAKVDADLKALNK